MKKVCTYCGLEKDIESFRQCKRKNGKMYYRSECKKCEGIKHNEYVERNREKVNEARRKRYDENKDAIKIKQKEYRDNHKEEKAQSDKRYRETHKDYIKKYKTEYRIKNKGILKEKNHGNYIENKEYYKEKNKKYRETHKEEAQKYAKEYRISHKEEIKQYNLEHRNEKRENQRKWCERNPDKVKKYRDKYYEKVANDNVLKLKRNLRNMLVVAFKKKGFVKSKKAEEICGCSMENLIKHLIKTYEKNYNEEWTWACKDAIHIDHIIPLATAKTEEDIIKLNHYTNLQLLKKEDNLEKSYKLDWKLQNK